MIARLRNLLGLDKTSGPRCLRFDRPLVLLQSDDWGRVGVRDRAGWEELRAQGLNLGERPYDFYSLETAEDLGALAEVLRKHRDTSGRHPSIVMNFIMANVDFHLGLQGREKEIPLRPLTQGLPEGWQRPKLFEGYQEGIQNGLFYPAMHGLNHFCKKAVTRELNASGSRGELLKQLWRAGTPYIYWRMPWIGYEYWEPEVSARRRFLSAREQIDAISSAVKIFRDLFGAGPLSACAPGYRANEDSRTAWFESGVRVAQNGPSEQNRPYLNESGMLFTFRSIEMEPAMAPCVVEELVAQAERCFANGVPAVISSHSINFHSTIRDFRTSTIALLDEFLSRLEKRWPNLLYIHDGDLFSIATAGAYEGESGRMKVRAMAAEDNG